MPGHKKLIFGLYIILTLLLVVLYYAAGPEDYKNISFLAASAFCLIFGYSLRPAEAQKSEIQLNFNPTLVALIIFILGAAIRFYGLDFGLPHNFHPDEVPKVNAVMRMKEQGSLDPDYFLHPSLLLYSTYFMNFLFHKFGASGTFQETAFLAGRSVSAIAGSISVFIVYLISKEIYSKKAALFSSLLLAVFPVHVACSRYLKEDSLLVFFILLTLYLVLLSLRKDSLKFLFMAGVTAGLSSSTKYSGALACAIIFFAPWLKSGTLIPDKRFFIGGIVSVLFVAFGFLIATPYSILNYTKFIKDVGYESRHMSKGHTTAVDGWSQYWMYHLSRSIIPGTSLLVTMIALIQCGIISRKKNLKELYIVVLFVLFYLSAEYIKSKPAPQPERYILPCIPLLAVIAAGFFDTSVYYLKSKTLRSAILFLIFLFPFIRTAEISSEIKNDTRIKLKDWISSNIPLESKFLIDFKAYGPLIEGSYDVKYIGGSNILQDLDASKLRKSGYDYLILSSLFYNRYFSEPMVAPVARQRIRELSKYFDKTIEISPEYGTYGFHNPNLIVYSLKAKKQG